MGFLNKKKRERKRLIQSFGKLKNESFNFDLIERYFRKKDNKDAFQILSDRTCSDIDFSELFMVLDRTNSKVGQQYIYDKLRIIPKVPEFAKQEKLINWFIHNQETRVSVQRKLEELGSNETYYITSLFQDEHIRPPKWYFIVPLLSLSSLISLLLLPFNPQMFLLLIGVFVINTGIHYWNKKNLYQYLGSIPQLLVLNKVACDLFKYENFKIINTELPKALKVIDEIKIRMSFFKLEARLDGDLGTALWAVMEFVKTVFILEPLLLFGALEKLDTRRDAIEEVFRFVGEIDAMISIASLRSGLLQYCTPEVHEQEKYIKGKGVYHPLLPSCVRNDIEIDGKSILLTGSNMSGKTSFIRTIGINLITGLTINTCFASQFSLSQMRIFSAIRISDDLLNDKSYYFEEVLAIKAMIKESQEQEPCLFLLDEIYKGTNTVERISAGKAVLSALSSGNNIVFVSTHDIELADFLKDEYQLFHFSEVVENNTVDFDYKLKEGKLKMRNAIRILQINGYPDQVVLEAIELSKQLDEVSCIYQE
ncbi:DNA mismatch repair protein MutS [Fulvivirga sp. 29W222]|uniref:DNA mismatch repair protein MutS n=1 Tax=Fulvivirga marina TaxID=2494733 RepID=A0A937KB33_9BACT|nr:DNA mismatch repair protein MutS [Fulvivirga marina]MBL6445517.1 DNA mismatch repair protein MutS [Fulvivirga marina]